MASKKCDFNPSKGINYISDQFVTLKKDNIHREMAKAASMFAKHPKALLSIATDPETREEAVVFVADMVEQLVNPENFGFVLALDPDLRTFLEKVSEDTAELDAFVEIMTSNLAGATAESTGKVAAAPISVPWIEGIEPPEALGEEITTSHESEEGLPNKKREINYTYITPPVSESNTVITESELISRNFGDIKYLHTDEFKPLIERSFVNSLIAQLSTPNRRELNVNALVMDFKKSLKGMYANAPADLNRRVLTKEASYAEREMYYYRVAADNINTTIALYSSGVVRVTKQGKYRLNTTNNKVSTTWDENDVKDGIQWGQREEAFLKSTTILDFVGMDSKNRPIYKPFVDKSYFDKNDVILIGQYLNRYVAKNLAPKGISASGPILFDIFKNPNIMEEGDNQTDRYFNRLMHSFVTRFLGTSKYGIEATSTAIGDKNVKSFIGLAEYKAKSKIANTILGEVEKSLLAQFSGQSIGSRISVVNNTVNISTGEIQTRGWDLSEKFEQKLLNTNGTYALSAEDIFFVQAGDSKNYKLTLKLGLRDSIDFKYEGNFDMATGIKPAGDTLIEELRQLTPAKLIKVMRKLRLPTYMLNYQFVNKYRSSSRGTTNPRLSIEYFIANTAFMVAANMSTNRDILNGISSSILPPNVGSTSKSNLELSSGERMDMLDFNPFKILKQPSAIIDNILTVLNGKDSSNGTIDPKSGYEHGTTPISVAQEFNRNYAVNQANDRPAGKGIKGFTPDAIMSHAVRGAVKSGANVKGIADMNPAEHVQFGIHSLFMGLIIDSDGMKAGFEAGAFPDSARPHAAVMNADIANGHSFLRGQEKEFKQSVADYTVEYYDAMTQETITNWRKFFGKIKDGEVFLRDLDGVTTLSELDSILRQLGRKNRVIPLDPEEVRAGLVEQLDYVIINGVARISPEYIYMAENLFGDNETAMRYLQDKEREFLGSPEIAGAKGINPKFRVTATELDYLRIHTNNPELKKAHATKLVLTSYFWGHTAFAKMFQRNTYGDIINFKSTINRENLDEYRDDFYAKAGYGTRTYETAQDQEAAFNRYVNRLGLSSMFKDQAKRANTSVTGVMRPVYKNPNEAGSELQYHNTVEGTGGVYSFTFDEIQLKESEVEGLDVLGFLKSVRVGDAFDGLEIGLPIYFLQKDASSLLGMHSKNGSASKSTGIASDGYSTTLEKSSTQQLLSYENARKSAEVRWMIKMMASGIKFQGDEGVLIKLPKVIIKGNEAKIVSGEFVETRVHTMYDLYLRLGGELGNNLNPSGMSSWDYIHEVILAGHDSSGRTLSNHMSNKYVGLLRTTSSQKMGNKKINSAKKLTLTTSIEDLKIDLTDINSHGDILNPGKKVNTSDTADEVSMAQISSQVVRFLGTGGNNNLETAIIHEVEGVVAEFGYENHVRDRIEDLKVKRLIVAGYSPTFRESDLSDRALYNKANKLLTNLGPDGFTYEDFQTLSALAEKGGDELTQQAYDKFFDEIVQDVLRHRDEGKNVLEAFNSKSLTGDSKQVKNIITQSFASSVNKSSIKRKAKGMQNVLGPTHGLIHMFKAVSADGLPMNVTWDDYGALVGDNYFREIIPADITAYVPYISSNTIVKLGESGIEMRVGEYSHGIINEVLSPATSMSDQLSKLNVEGSESIVSQLKTELESGSVTVGDLEGLIVSTLLANPANKFKVPDINSKRELKYLHFVKKEFRDGILSLPNNPTTVFDLDEYQSLKKARNKIRPKRFRPIKGEKRVFTSDDTTLTVDENFAKAKADAMTYIRSKHAAFADSTLFKINKLIFEFIDLETGYYDNDSDEIIDESADKWTLEPYDYAKTKYSKEEYALYQRDHSHAIDMSYEDYVANTDPKFDVNGDIHDLAMRRAVQGVQDRLNEVISIAKVTLDNGNTVDVEIKAEFNSIVALQEAEMPGGYYLVGGQVTAYGLGVIVESVVEQPRPESLWHALPTELIMPPNNQTEFLINDGDSVTDPIKNISYTGKSREESLRLHEESIQQRDKSIYTKGASEEYQGLILHYNEKIIKTINDFGDSRIPFKVFNSMMNPFSAKSDLPFKEHLLREEEHIQVLLAMHPEYSMELYSRLEVLQDLKASYIKDEDFIATVGRAKGGIDPLQYEKLDGLKTELMQAYSGYMESAKYHYTSERAAELAYSYNASLQTLFARIPAQDKQSISKGITVSYMFDSGNTTLGSPELLLISGADYDIDKLYMTVYDINSKGQLSFLETAGLGSAIDAEGAVDKSVIDKWFTLQVAKYAEILGTKKLDPVVFTDRLQTYKESVKSDIIKMLRNETLRNHFKVVTDPKNFSQSQTPISTDNLTAQLGKINYKEPLADGYNIVSNGRLQSEGMGGKKGIGVGANGTKLYSMAYIGVSRSKLDDSNLIPKNTVSRLSGTNMSKVTKVLKKSNPELLESLMTTAPGKGLFQIALQGKDGKIKIHKADKVADSVRATSTFHENEVKVQGLLKILKLQDPDSELAYIDQVLFDNKTIDYDLHKLKSNVQAWELMSEILSAATDNAKLLILDKLGLNPTAMSLVHTMITVGFSLDVAFEVINRPIAKDVIKKTEESGSALEFNTKSYSFKYFLAGKAARMKLYDKENKRLRSGSKAFAPDPNSGKSQFEVSYKRADLSSEEQLRRLNTMIETELLSEIGLLYELADINESLRRIGTMAKITKGMDTDIRGFYIEQNAVNSFMKSRLIGQDELIDTEDGEFKVEDAQVIIDMKRFYTEDTPGSNGEPSYTQQMIDFMGRSSKSGYNILEIIYQNKDIYRKKRVQMKSLEDIGRFQKVDASVPILASYMKLDPSHTNFEQEQDYTDKENLLEELIVAEFLRKFKYTNFEMASIGASFDLTTPEGRYKFVSSMDKFNDYLQNRLIADDDVYQNNSFIKSLEVTGSKYANPDERFSPKYFITDSIKNIKNGIKAQMEDDYKKLDANDRAVFEMLSIIVSKGVRSQSSHVALIGLDSLKPYSQFKSQLLRTDGAVETLVQRVSQTQLLLNAPRSINTINTDSSPSYKGIKTHANFMALDKFKFEPKDAINGVLLARSAETRQIYARVDAYADLLKETNGAFPIFKTKGLSTIAYDTEHGANATGIEAILKSGAEPMAITYKVASTDDTKEGYLLGRNEGRFVIIDKTTLKYDKVNSKAAKAEDLEDLNATLLLDGEFVGIKSLSQMSTLIQGESLTSDVINENAVRTVIHNEYSLSDFILDKYSKIVVPRAPAGNIRKGKIVSVVDRDNYKYIVRYVGKAKPKEGRGYRQVDIKTYSNFQGDYAVYEVVPVEYPSALSILKPSDINSEWSSQADDYIFRSKVFAKDRRYVVNNIREGRSSMAVITPEEFTKWMTSRKDGGKNLHTESIPVNFKAYKERDNWQISSYLGEFENYADLKDFLLSKNIVRIKKDENVDKVVEKLFGVTNYSSVMKSFMTAPFGSKVHIFSFLPWDQKYKPSRLAINQINNRTNIKVPEDFNIYIGNKIASPLLQRNESIHLGRTNISVMKYEDELSPEILTQIRSEVNTAFAALGNVSEKTSYQGVDIDKTSSPIISEGLTLRDKSAVVLKVPSLIDTSKNAEGEDRDLVRNVSPKNVQRAVELMYLKKYINKAGINIPLYVYNESNKTFLMYNPSTGLFAAQTEGLMNVGKTPLVLGFSLDKSNTPDIGIVSALVRASSIEESARYEGHVIRNTKDQNLIDIQIEPTADMAVPVMSNEGIDGESFYSHIVNRDDVVIVSHDSKAELASNEQLVEVVEDEPMITVNGVDINISEAHFTFDESLEEGLKVETYNDGSLTIEVRNRDPKYSAETVDFYALIPEEVRTADYADFIAGTKYATIKGFVVDGKGKKKAVVFKNVIKTKRKFFERRDKNIEEREELKAKMAINSDAYSLRKVAYDKLIESDPTFKVYMGTIGGLKALNSMLKTRYMDNMVEKFPSLFISNEGELSLMDQFDEISIEAAKSYKDVLDYVEETVVDTREMNKSKEVTRFTEDLYGPTFKVDPLTQAIVLFTDYGQNTQMAKVGIERAWITDKVRIKDNTFKKGVDKNDAYSGAFMVNPFRTTSTGGVAFASTGTVAFGNREIQGIVNFLEFVSQSETDFLLQFPSLSERVSNVSDITYQDMANLLIKAVNKLGRVPENLKMSPELAEYVENNSGARDISNLYLNTRIYIANTEFEVNSTLLDNVSPKDITLPNGGTMLDMLNRLKGLPTNTYDMLEPAAQGSFYEGQDPEDILIKEYENVFRTKTGVIFGILSKLTGYNGKMSSVVSRRLDVHIRPLVKAMNNLLIDPEVPFLPSIELEVQDLKSFEINRHVISKKDIVDQGLSVDIGSRYTLDMNGSAFIVEIEVGGEKLQDKNQMPNYKLINGLNMDVQEVGDVSGDDVIVKIYKDPSTHIGNTDKVYVKGQLGSDIETIIADNPLVQLSEENKNILDQGNQVLVFNDEVKFGYTGVYHSKTDSFLNEVSKHVGTNILNPALMEEDTVISILTNSLGNLSDPEYINRKSKKRAKSPQDLKEYFDGTVKPMLDNYIIHHGLTVAIGSKPGVSQEIRSYLISKGYRVNGDGNLEYKPTTFLQSNTSEKVIISSNKVVGFNSNVVGRNGEFSGVMGTPMARSYSQSEKLFKRIRRLSGQSTNEETYTYLNILDTVTMHDLVKDSVFKSMIANYKLGVLKQGESIDSTRNNDFISEYISKLTGDLETSQAAEWLGLMFDAEGVLQRYNPETDEMERAPKMTQLAVARSKHAAIKLIYNNLQYRINTIDAKTKQRLDEFAAEQVQLDVLDSHHRAIDISKGISKEEFAEISSDSGVSYFDLYLYDITSAPDKNYSPNLVPNESYFIGKMLNNKIGRIRSIAVDATQNKYPLDFILDTASIVDNDGNITTAGFDETYREVREIEGTAMYKTLIKYDPGLARYLKNNGSGKYDLGDLDIKVDTGTGFNVTEVSALRDKVKFNLVQELLEQFGSGMDEVLMFEGDMNYYLNYHIKMAQDGVPLKDTLFQGKRNTITELTTDSVGQLTNAAGLSVKGSVGMLIRLDGLLRYITNTGYIYEVSADSLSNEVKIGRAASTGPSIEERLFQKGSARIGKEGNIFNSIRLDAGEESILVEDPVEIDRVRQTSQWIARSLSGKGFYVYDIIKGAWSKVDITSNDTNHAFIAARKPADIKPTTTKIVADGMVYTITDPRVTDNIITTSEGWKFEFNPVVESYKSITSEGVKPKSIKARFHKKALELNYETSSFRSREAEGRVLRKVIKHLSKQTNIAARMLSTEEILEEYGRNYSTSLGFTYNDVVVINTDLATLDTPMHEFGHFFFKQLRNENPELFAKLKAKALKSSIAAEIQSNYANLGETSDEMAEEILTSMLGLHTQQLVLDSVEKGFVRRALDTIKSWFDSGFGVKNKGYEMAGDSTISEVMNQIGTQLLYGPRSILHDTPTRDKSHLKSSFSGTVNEKEALSILEEKGFIVKIC